jgi:Na+/H+-dicarboxylate symporter/ABC-type amino acid transport substrate-binding protein
MKTPSLGVMVSIGGLAGILAGIFFGEYCRVLSPLGSAYIMLLQSAVFPYLVCSLIYGLGSLAPATALQLFKRGWIFYFFAWTLTLISVWVLALSLPSAAAPALLDETTKPDTASRLLDVFFPANIFSDLSRSYIPAIVAASVLYGVAIQGFARKTAILDVMDAIRLASTKIWGWVVKLAPLAVFALFAELAGTISLARIEQLGVYVLLFITGTLLLAFWVLPGIIGALTPYSARRVLGEIKDGLYLAAATSLPVAAVPAIVAATQKLAGEAGVREEHRDEIVKTTMAITYPLGQLGNLYVYLFIFFAASFYQTSLSVLQQLLLPVTTLFSTFGTPASTVDAVAFIKNWLQLPTSATDLYVESWTLLRYPQVLASAVGLAFITMLVTVSFYGRIRFQATRFLLALGLPVLTFAAIAFGAVHLETLLSVKEAVPYWSFTLPASITEGVQSTVYRDVSKAPQIDRSDGARETTFQRIQRTGTLRVGYNIAAFPFSYFNERDELVGFDVAMAYELARSLDVKLWFIPFAWDELRADLGAGRFDIAMSGIYLASDIHDTSLRIHTLDPSEPYYRSNLVLIVPSQNAEKFRSRTDVEAISNLRVATFSSPEMKGVVQNLLPAAKVVSVNNYYDLPRFEGFDAALWTEAQAVALVRTRKGITAVRPADFGNPFLFTYLMPGDSPEFLRYVNYWLKLEETGKFAQQMIDHWIQGQPLPDNKPRWSVIRDVLHWVK